MKMVFTTLQGGRKMKLLCAKKAYEMIEDSSTVGLGGGSTVALIADLIAQGGKRVSVVTPSYDTEELCRAKGIDVLPLDQVNAVSVAFDGCDELDPNLDALKSCGGIHTREKIVAGMAESYVLLADETKVHERLEFSFPVTLEVLPAARELVRCRLEKMGAAVSMRKSPAKAGLAIGDDGGYLMEADFSQVMGAAEPAYGVRELSDTLDRLPGVIAHGLFANIASAAIIAGTEGVRVIRKI